MKGDEEETVLRKTLASLDAQRKALEHEADAILLELTTPPDEGVEPMGLDTPLVDFDGYPRNDIDVYRARSQRNRFNVIKTDHKELQRKIEALLLQLTSMKAPSKKGEQSEEQARRLAPKPKPKFDAVTGKWVVMNWDGSVSGIKGGDSLSFEDLSKNREATETSDSTPASEGSASSSSERNGDNQLPPSAQKRPFAKVDAIAIESPAEAAGMQVGDLVTRFGPLDADNHDRLRALAKLVPEVAGEEGRIQLVVLRRSSSAAPPGDDEAPDYEDESKWEKHMLILSPRPFSGRGLLGCHILPFD